MAKTGILYAMDPIHAVEALDDVDAAALRTVQGEEIRGATDDEDAGDGGIGRIKADGDAASGETSDQAGLEGGGAAEAGEVGEETEGHKDLTPLPPFP